MIHFVCEHCGKPVRVPEAFAGKKGRCPFCKAVVNIPPPAAAGASDAAAELAAAAALAGAARDEAPPPRPPSRIEDVAEPKEPELDLASATDPRSKTDRLGAIEDGGVIDFADDEEQTEAVEAASREPTPLEQARASQRAQAEAIKAAKKRRMLIGGAVLLVLIVAAGVVALVWKPWEEPAPTPSREPQARKARPAVAKRTPPARSPRLQPTVTPKPTPRPTPRPAPRPTPTGPKQFPLSPELLAATERAPDGAFFLLHVDLHRAAKAMAKASASRAPVIAQVAGSKLWTNATRRIREGAMPASGTLFLAGGSPVEISRMFGMLYGQRPGSAVPGSTPGLWSLAEDDAPVPHFLLRLAGPAARNLSADLLGRATDMKLKGTFQADKPASHGVLRLAPARLSGMDGAGEMLVGTAETIDDAGRCKVNPAQQERIRALLAKVPTKGRAIVGCAKLPALRACVRSALSAPMTEPAWEGQQTALVFSIDPEPRGKATILLSQPPSGSLEQVTEHAGSLRASEEGEDIRLQGPGQAGLAALADFLPGFRQVAIKALAMAKPVPARVAVRAKPKPKRRTPPTRVRRVAFLCFYSHCSTRKRVFYITSDKVPPTVMDGTEAMLCPKCGKKQAVVAVSCPNCMRWTPQTLENCTHCRRSLTSMGPRPKPPEPSEKPAPKTP